MIFRHAGLVVSDLKKSLRFWTKDIGFKVASNNIEKGKVIEKVLKLDNCKINSIKLTDSTNKICLELIYFEKPKLKKKKIFTNSPGLTHIAITVKDINKLYNKLLKKVNFLCKPILSDDKKVKLAYARVDGTLFIEFVEKL